MIPAFDWLLDAIDDRPRQMSDTIYVRPGDRPPVVPSSRKGWVKHVHCEGARFHVVSYLGSERVCSEPRCVLNAPVESA